MEGKPILEVNKLAFSYTNHQETFSDISLRLDKGDIFTILGANGAGKSTLLNCLSNLLTPLRGNILLKGRDITHIPINEIAKVLGYVPQVHIPTFAYSIRDYVVMGRAPHMGLLSVPREAEYEKVDTVLEQMGIEHLADKLYTQISGGERQQVQIARVLVQESEIILFDEPTNHLDYGNQLKILQIIADLAKKGLTILMTTHMPDHAILLGGKVGILDREGHMLVGAAETIISEESLKNIYNTQLHLIYIEQLKRMTCVAGNIK
ncbi:MAG: ABC transporter ATP-binding protein [Desulfosporosinus sp.]|nr:ABC transporter ATP-binding protein [Desulfosporosinus sp.]